MRLAFGAPQPIFTTFTTTTRKPKMANTTIGLDDAARKALQAAVEKALDAGADGEEISAFVDRVVSEADGGADDADDAAPAADPAAEPVAAARKLTKRELDLCARKKIDPKAYAANKLGIESRRPRASRF